MARLSKALLHRAADRINKQNSYTCTAVAWNRGNDDARDDQACRQYQRAAHAAGWPKYPEDGELYTLDHIGFPGDEDTHQAMRFDFLNLLAEAGPECW